MTVNSDSAAEQEGDSAVAVIEKDLAGVTILSGLLGEDLDLLAGRCSWRRYEPEQFIIDQNSPSRDVCFVTDGRARIVIYAPNGREISFDDVVRGHYFGELAAIDGEPRSASAIALEPTTVAHMSPEVFIDLLVEYPTVALDVMRGLARIVRLATSRIMDLSVLGANNRVQAEVLRLAREASGDGMEARIRPIPVHSDIAARVSTTRETVARVFSDLARHDLVVREGHALVVKDIPRLEGMVAEVKSA
jgi:CRP/FNR family transcriptional regulator, cyclic AMP receptor protein